jgi:hypothetical protein
MWPIYIAHCLRSNVYKLLPNCPVRAYLPGSDLAIAKLLNCSEYRIAASTIKNAGRGLFAMRTFNSGDQICDYYGYVLTDKEYEWIVENGFFINTGVNLNGLIKGKVKCSLAGVPGYPASVINHDAERKNCGFVIYSSKQTETGFQKGWLVAEVLKGKTVCAGDEFFCDYGPEANHINSQTD